MLCGGIGSGYVYVCAPVWQVFVPVRSELYLMQAHLPRFWKFLRIIAWVTAFGSFGWSYYLWYQYAFTRPTVPEPRLGRVYSLNTHGSVVYLTKKEELLLYSLIGTAAVSSVIGICLERLPKRLRD